MTTITQTNPNPNAGTTTTGTGSRKPYLKPEAGTSWFTVKPADDIYGPCSLEISIETVGVLGADGQANLVKAFCDGFNDFAATCVVKGYGVKSGVWTVNMDLASEKAAASKPYIDRVSATLTPYLQASPILQRQHGFGKAKCRVLVGVATRFTDDLN